MAAARLRPAESCSDIANAGTSPTTPSAANEAVIRPVAVLLWSSAVNPAPAPNAAKRLRSAFERRRTQIGTERSNGPALDHVQVPKAARQCPPTSRGERAYPSARGLGSQLLGLPSARREFELGLWLLRSPFPGNGISPSIRQGIKESVEPWRGILKQSVSYDQVIDMRFVNEVRKRAERSTSGEISHRTGQAIEKLPATGCPTQL